MKSKRTSEDIMSDLHARLVSAFGIIATHIEKNEHSKAFALFQRVVRKEIERVNSSKES